MPEPTTIEELEDWHLKYGPCSICRQPKCGCRYRRPITTIDAAVLAMPKGWTWERANDKLTGYGPKPPEVEVYITSHTPEAIRRDLLALARLAWIAEGATP